MLPVLLALLVVAPPPDTSWSHQDLRERMVQQQIAARGLTDPAVRGALRSVPRHRFVPEVSPELAYADRPLPIGHDQTISQPYIVARMTALVRPDSADRVLEVGTGSGYQAAVLASIVDSVYTIEIIPDLAASATERLRRLGYHNIVVRNGDGFDGWPARAPFDAIVVTAAPDAIPPPLLDQLADGGRMIVPVGPAGGPQDLTLVTNDDGKLTRRTLAPVRFVPFLRPEP
ncbi:protein-L-isoaspartate(D-aspartate) O-methyltransferase [Salinibacter ruber]|uniref:protein-L-isoaspartate(D-aspartate) O-methyltransferase n=1 Tax=Salinibacter ruber TaxID=146919 RepID=UPI002169E583|nr:protein-L-isoaspartate(D-aspartate) O-methyltransferase [Salinibacter ruber]MCS3756993.1 protein-L-isoaspartate(D-aspartate) O-methyltransferase [Salinibacter ruber]MCS3955857.1 protein-L-isoaspartate(D-aspartate) O-methyltransferase [Salinibacter ruber]